MTNWYAEHSTEFDQHVVRSEDGHIVAMCGEDVHTARKIAALPDLKRAAENALAEAEQALQSKAERPADLLEECDVRLNAIQDALSHALQEVE